MKGKSQGGQTAGRHQGQHGQGATGQVLRAEGGPQTAGEEGHFFFRRKGVVEVTT